MATYLPLDLKVATLNKGEKQIASFFIKRLTFELSSEHSWYARSDETEYHAHLTSQRIILEPSLHGKGKKALAYVLSAVKLLQGIGGKDPLDKIEDWSEADKAMIAQGFISWKFNEIVRIEHLYQNPLGRKYDIQLGIRTFNGNDGSEVCIVFNKKSPLTQDSVYSFRRVVVGLPVYRGKPLFIFNAHDSRSFWARQGFISSTEANKEFVNQANKLLRKGKR